MCGRMSLSKPDWETLRALLEADVDPELAASWQPRYNVAPTQPHPILRLDDRGKRRLQPAAWGFAPVDKRPLINARAESLAERARFQGSRRCVVPADGFFEWHDAQPYWYHAPDGQPLLMAGLWEPAPDGPRFVVVTTAANALVAPAHDRMPALLSPACIGEWLARPALELLAPAPPEALVARPVSPRVGSPDHDDAALLEPVRPRGQLSLF
jgi:putative SOS response-associated peptidase YedK